MCHAEYPMNYAQTNIYECTVYTQHPAEGFADASANARRRGHAGQPAKIYADWNKCLDQLMSLPWHKETHLPIRHTKRQLTKC